MFNENEPFRRSTTCGRRGNDFIRCFPYINSTNIPPPPPPPPYFNKSAVRGEGNTPAQEIIPQLFNIYKIIGEYNSRAGTFGNGSLI